MYRTYISLLIIAPVFCSAALPGISEGIHHTPSHGASLIEEFNLNLNLETDSSYKKIGIGLGGLNFYEGAFFSGFLGEDANYELSYSKDVKYRDGVELCWVIMVDTKKPALELKTVFTLPSQSEKWIIHKDTEVLQGGKVAVTKAIYSMHDGYVSRCWTLSDSDPKGEYTYEVYYKDKRIFEATVNVE